MVVPRSGKHIGVSWPRTHDLWTPLNQHHRSDSRGTKPGNYLHRDLWVCTERTASLLFLFFPLPLLRLLLAILRKPSIHSPLDSTYIYIHLSPSLHLSRTHLFTQARNHFSYRNYTWPANLSIIQSREDDCARARSCESASSNCIFWFDIFPFFFFSFFPRVSRSDKVERRIIGGLGFPRNAIVWWMLSRKRG